MTSEDWTNLERWDRESKAGREADSKIADFYYEHREDPDFWSMWEEVPVERRPKGIRKPPGIVVSVRFSAPDLLILEDTAEREGLTLSELVRRSVAEYAERHRVTVRMVATQGVTVSAG